MLDLVIVEDESNIRDCLTHLFPWNSLGINVVANFSNGQDAFHYQRFARKKNGFC